MNYRSTNRSIELDYIVCVHAHIEIPEKFKKMAGNFFLRFYHDDYLMIKVWN